MSDAERFFWTCLLVGSAIFLIICIGRMIAIFVEWILDNLP